MNPIAFTEKVVANFLRYQLTRYPFADAGLYAQMRALLSLESTRDSPLLQGPYVSLSRSFRQGAAVGQLVHEGVLHPLLETLVPHAYVYGHQEKAIRSIVSGHTTLVSTGTGSGKTECFLYPIISRCLQLRDEGVPPGISAVLIYPMNALAEDQMVRLRGLLAGSGIPFGMYAGTTPQSAGDGAKLPPGSSRADYRASVDATHDERHLAIVRPAEERCSRDEMRAPGGQPRILITNVKQLELLLTRQADAELFDNARLDFLVCDEAHTFSGANGAETACLLRRLRTYCGHEVADTTCVATSATLADRHGGDDAGRAFAARFFGVPSDRVILVTEEYAADTWHDRRVVLDGPPGDPADHLRAILASVDDASGDHLRSAYQALTGQHLTANDWQTELFEQLVGNEVVYQIATCLERARRLSDLLSDLAQCLGRPIVEEEVLTWLVLGALARGHGRPLLRPVVHAFIRGINGAVVTFPTDTAEPKLWLSAEDERKDSGDEQRVRLPVLNCTTCGQHYFEHQLEGFDYTSGAPGGGQAVAESRVWYSQAPTLGGNRLLLVDHIVGAADDDDEPARTTELFMCRTCGAVHPQQGSRCTGCGVAGALLRLLAMSQKPETSGKLTRCVACGAPGRQVGSRYFEPIRPVRAVTVADVHVLAQDMVHHADRRRLLVFADNRQDAAFQSGWMRDHSRRFRLRALMSDRIKQGAISIGDLTAHLDEQLDQDDDLSRVLVPEVWEVQPKEAEGLKHGDERKHFLRIQVLRELTTGLKQTIGLEPWGRMRVRYRGLDADAALVVNHAALIDVPPADLADGIAVLLDIARRRDRLLLDSQGGIFTRFWQDGEREIQRNYLPKLPGGPKGLKLTRSASDNPSLVSQWLGQKRHPTSARQIVGKWGFADNDVEAFFADLWRFLTSEVKLLVRVTLTGAKGRPVQDCHGVYQIDGDLLKLVPSHEVYRCKKCRRAQVRRTPHLRCPAWHCDGVLQRQADNPDSYDLSLLDGGVEMIRPREHSGQVPAAEREKAELLFKGKSNAVNTLVCTPTLELGVDIGDLDTVLMRNIPPLPANYWQRVGRAGRRHRMAVNIAYARPLSHDQSYFADPTKMLEGRIDPPRFNLKNDRMVRKHVHATILTRLHQLVRPGSGLDEFDRDEIYRALETAFPRQIAGYLFSAAGELLSRPFDVTPLRTVTSKHAADLHRYVVRAFHQGWPEVDAAVVAPRVLASYIAESADRLDDVIQLLRKRLNSALHQLDRLGDERKRKGTLDPMEDMQFRRCDLLVKRMKGQRRRTRQSDEGFDDTNTYAALAAEGYLPGYGLEEGAIVGSAQLPRHVHGGGSIDLRRPSSIGVREFVPGNLIYANGQKFIPRFFRLGREVEPTYFTVDIGNRAVAEIGARSTSAGLGATEIRAVEICDVDLPHQSHITDDEEFRFQIGVSVLGYERGRWNGGTAYRWGARDVLHRRGVHLRLLNIGVTKLIEGKERKLGYSLCLVCGQSRSPYASKAELDRFEADHADQCKKAVERTGFYADDVADAISLPECEDHDEAYSVLEALRTGAAQLLEMDMEDLDILVIGRAGTERVNALLIDPMPGGSGLLDQICERFPEVVAAALAVVEHCPSNCTVACPDCLCRFRNAFFHKHLQRALAADRLRSWGDRLNFAHDMPVNLPNDAVGNSMPVNQAEATLKANLSRAGFTGAKWHRQIDLGRPLGTTSPDCYFPDDDPSTPGVCVYLDGLSQHLHGNPATHHVDRTIREQLRAMDYEVIEIAASDLSDRTRMAEHFFNLGRLVVGKPKAREVRDNLNWFQAPDLIESAATTVARPFRIVTAAEPERDRTCVPLMSLRAAASGFGETSQVDVSEWVVPNTTRILDQRMFVAQVVGKSMEPRIRDGAYCLFRHKPVAGSRSGRILLVQHRDITDPETGGSYTVKVFDSTGVSGKGEDERSGTIHLRPLNPAFAPIVLKDAMAEDVDVVAEFLEVLEPMPDEPAGH